MTTNYEGQEDIDNSYDSTLEQLPSDCIPGTDWISKRVLKTQAVIDMIVNSLLNVPNGTYCVTDTALENGQQCDILCMPRIGISELLPPVLLEVQGIVTNKFIQRTIEYCLAISKRYGVLPITIIFCIKKVSPTELLNRFAASSMSPIFLTLASDCWAQYCHLITHESADKEEHVPLSPLQAIALFLTCQQRNVVCHPYAEDPTINQLYRIALDCTTIKPILEENFVGTLRFVCNTNEKIFSSVKAGIKHFPGLTKTVKQLDRGINFNKKLKRRYDHIQDDSDSDSSLDLPPKTILMERQQSSEQDDCLVDDMKFVLQFMNKSHGRISWHQCLLEGRQKGHCKKYANGESLRVQYSKYKKMQKQKA